MNADENDSTLTVNECIQQRAKKLSLTEKQEELPFVSGKMKKASSSSPRNRTIIITNIISYRYRVERKK